MILRYFLPLTLFLAAVPASAAVTGPELYISSTGEIHILNAQIENRNAVNMFSVRVWGILWTVPMDQWTSVEDAGGTKIDPSQILDNHFLEIKGRVVWNDINRRGWLDTRLVRDLSLGTPSAGSSGQASLLQALTQTQPSPAPSAVPAPKPTPAQEPTVAPQPAPAETPISPAKAAKKMLARNMRPAMRGGEVIILQEFLQKNGWGIPDDGPVTGYYGKVTVNAVKKFQVANGLPPEGEVGPKTRALINELLKTQP